ncbi:MAG: hypothetical protein AB7L84_01290 [Acidimicrobiia bacterium]
MGSDHPDPPLGLDPDRLRGEPIEAIRAARAARQEREAALSLARRVVQGRLDIVGTELRRRAEGGDPSDLHALVERLPDVLAASPAPATSARPTGLDEVPPVDEATRGELDRIIGEAGLASLPTVDDGRLAAMAEELAVLERRLSEDRRVLHEEIDRLQAEVIRRYREGEATVDELLGGR